MHSPPLRRALLSVSDKSGLVEFARALVELDVELFATGGTRAALEQASISVREVSAYTGFPEMMHGRLKTLHPKIHGGILCRRDNPEDMESLRAHEIVLFDLVVVNLYPFQATVARAGVTLPEAIEQIDIGGPSLIRAAAKNHAFVAVATSPAQYVEIAGQAREHGATTPEARIRWAAAAFAHTAEYDRGIAEFFATRTKVESDAPEGGFPPSFRIDWPRQETLRYGENPHQRGALYAEPNAHGANVVTARKLHGKELSYNNLLDLDSALAITRGLPAPSVAVIKHNNPCGAASNEVLSQATRDALDGDSLSAFGAVLGYNRPLDTESALTLAEPGRFIEAIVAPSFTEEALEILRTRPKWKANVRLLEVGETLPEPPRWDCRRVAGGMLVQDADLGLDDEAEWRVVTSRQPGADEWRDLRFAWTISRFVKSNAIVVAKDRVLLGAGAGQMSRVDSAEIAIKKAGARARGGALASDAFFPFADSVELAATAGVTTLVQPGGSRADADVIAACDRLGLAMVFTGRRHFKH